MAVRSHTLAVLLVSTGYEFSSYFSNLKLPILSHQLPETLKLEGNVSDTPLPLCYFKMKWSLLTWNLHGGWCAKTHIILTFSIVFTMYRKRRATTPHLAWSFPLSHIPHPSLSLSFSLTVLWTQSTFCPELKFRVWLQKMASFDMECGSAAKAFHFCPQALCIFLSSLSLLVFY